MVKSRKIFTALIGAAVLTASVAGATSAHAQVTRIPQAAPDQMLPVYEVINIVRAHGLDPVGAPLLHGVTYRTRAMDRTGRELSVVVDARYGDVLLVERADPLPYPERRVAAMPPAYDDPEFLDGPPPAYAPPAYFPPYPPRAVKPTPRVATVPAQKRPPLPKAKPEMKPEAVAAQGTAPAPTAPAAAPPAPKPETAQTTEAPTKWKDEPAPTNAPPAAPKVPDVAPLE